MFENIQELLPHKDEENTTKDMPCILFIVFSFESWIAKTIQTDKIFNFMTLFNCCKNANMVLNIGSVYEIDVRFDIQGRLWS